ncbi:MAG TPA: aldose 1-epimerase [Steroidobacteraceae bacterium]|nr:aldose 1-epimerase [Steroidobacteraceae bacterium]
MATDPLVLERQAVRLVVAPQRGGAIREFRWRGEAVLRPASPGIADDPFTMACFPMVPFVNRIADGRLGFAGRTVQLRRNWSEDPHPLHGQGWRASWAVVAATSSDATLRFEGGGDDWPWRYRAEQRFELLDDALSIALAIENLSDTAMPAMLGLHPYFPQAAHARLGVRLPRLWRTDGAALPIEEVDTPPGWGFEPPRAVSELPLDHCFCGWNGHAVLAWPERTVTVRALDCAFLHVYAPTGRDFFCIEPQNGAPGRLAREADPAWVLAPGERVEIRVEFEVAAR